MQVLCLGLSHWTAPLQVRDKVSFPGSELGRAHLTLRNHVAEGIILSTCNRTEVYAVASDSDASTQESICQFLSEFHDVDSGLFAPHLYIVTDAEAVRHLFRVASGLDSLILGEPQILGQVRDALAVAAEAKSTGVILSRLFHYGLRTGRRARDETEIGKTALSASYVGVKLAQRMLGSLAGKTVLLVGAGEAGRLVARALRSVGVVDLFIANRTLSRANDLADEIQGSVLAFDKIGHDLKRVDIVISSTDAPGRIFCHSMVAQAMEGRNGRPLFLFDLAVPRDIDPDVADIRGVHLFNIDDLSTIAAENRVKREGAAEAAEAIVEEEVVRFFQWLRSLETVPLINELRAEAEALRCHELERAFRRLPNLDERERRVLEQVSRSIVNKMLHTSISALNQQRASFHLEVARGLEQLRETSSSRPRPR